MLYVHFIVGKLPRKVRQHFRSSKRVKKYHIPVGVIGVVGALVVTECGVVNVGTERNGQVVAVLNVQYMTLLQSIYKVPSI